MLNEHNEDLETKNEDFSAGFDQHVSDNELDDEQGLQTESASEEAESSPLPQY